MTSKKTIMPSNICKVIGCKNHVMNLKQIGVYGYCQIHALDMEQIKVKNEEAQNTQEVQGEKDG